MTYPADNFEPHVWLQVISLSLFQNKISDVGVSKPTVPIHIPTPTILNYLLM